MNILESHLNSLNFSSQLDSIKNLIDLAQAKTTFWGGRIVTVTGFTGSVYLDDIASKIHNASVQRCDADDLTPVERIAGVEVVGKLKNFYIITDAQIKNSNFFTRFLNWLREFSFLPYTTRFFVKSMTEGNFRAYSEARFLEQFGGSFDSKGDHPSSDGAFGPVSRILARESQIRALLIPS